MRRILGLLLAGCAILALAAPAIGAEQPKSEGAPPAMPEMGPPKEIAELDWLMGTWDAAVKSRMDPSVEKWEESKAVAVYSKTAGGAAIMMNYTGDMMGMAFEGVMLQCYDKENKTWQVTWVDNTVGRISIYTGTVDKNQSMMQGEDIWMGQRFISRMSTWNHKPTSFDWKMESSHDGGKTWYTNVTAVYTKRTK